jgi:hypothetical protein
VQLARALVRALGLALGAVTAGGQLANTPCGIELEQVGASWSALEPYWRSADRHPGTLREAMPGWD